MAVSEPDQADGKDDDIEDAQVAKTLTYASQQTQPDTAEVTQEPGTAAKVSATLLLYH
jgi:hypothetical protein